ncbi:MAG: hypothetical protein IK141_02045 [Clostridia bacterium]|nr:hypothetical protein [Clostridia bacterium]
MNRRISLTAAAGLALIAVVLALTLRAPSPAPPADGAVQPAATELPLSLPAESSASEGWRVGIYEGHVAVFSVGSQTPDQILDTAVASLPYADREALRRGIFVTDREALAALLEDYDG